MTIFILCFNDHVITCLYWNNMFVYFCSAAFWCRAWHASTHVTHNVAWVPAPVFYSQMFYVFAAWEQLCVLLEGGLFKGFFLYHTLFANIILVCVVYACLLKYSVMNNLISAIFCKQMMFFLLFICFFKSLSNSMY